VDLAASISNPRFVKNPTTASISLAAKDICDKK
jgi:hypothetical protein